MSSLFWRHLLKHGAILGITRSALGGLLGGVQEGFQTRCLFGMSRLGLLQAKSRGATRDMDIRVVPKGKGRVDCLNPSAWRAQGWLLAGPEGGPKGVIFGVP